MRFSVGLVRKRFIVSRRCVVVWLVCIVVKKFIRRVKYEYYLGSGIILCVRLLVVVVNLCRCCGVVYVCWVGYLCVIVLDVGVKNSGW